MRKVFIILVIILVLSLSSCIELTEDNLKIQLNPGVDTIEVDDQFIDAGANASFGFRTLHPVVIENDVDTSLVGIYTIIYQITYLEYEKTITRIVTVIDETPPNINLNPGVDTIVVGQAWIDAGVTAIDNSNLEVIITVTSYVIIEQPGEYQVIYQATDESGNSATIIRYVNIIELT